MTMTERQEVARRLRALDCKIRLTDTLESACNNLMQATYGIDHRQSSLACVTSVDLQAFSPTS